MTADDYVSLPQVPLEVASSLALAKDKFDRPINLVLSAKLQDTRSTMLASVYTGLFRNNNFYDDG